MSSHRTRLKTGEHAQARRARLSAEERQDAVIEAAGCAQGELDQPAIETRLRQLYPDRSHRQLEDIAEAAVAAHQAEAAHRDLIAPRSRPAFDFNVQVEIELATPLSRRGLLPPVTRTAPLSYRTLRRADDLMQAHLQGAAERLLHEAVPDHPDFVAMALPLHSAYTPSSARRTSAGSDAGAPSSVASDAAPRTSGEPLPSASRFDPPPLLARDLPDNARISMSYLDVHGTRHTVSTELNAARYLHARLEAGEGQLEILHRLLAADWPEAQAHELLKAFSHYAPDLEVLPASAGEDEAAPRPLKQTLAPVFIDSSQEPDATAMFVATGGATALLVARLASLKLPEERIAQALRSRLPDAAPAHRELLARRLAELPLDANGDILTQPASSSDGDASTVSSSTDHSISSGATLGLASETHSDGHSTRIDASRRSSRASEARIEPLRRSSSRPLQAQAAAKRMGFDDYILKGSHRDHLDAMEERGASLQERTDFVRRMKPFLNAGQAEAMAEHADLFRPVLRSSEAEFASRAFSPRRYALRDLGVENAAEWQSIYGSDRTQFDERLDALVQARGLSANQRAWLQQHFQHMSHPRLGTVEDRLRPLRQQVDLGLENGEPVAELVMRLCRENPSLSTDEARQLIKASDAKPRQIPVSELRREGSPGSSEAGSTPEVSTRAQGLRTTRCIAEAIVHLSAEVGLTRRQTLRRLLERFPALDKREAATLVMSLHTEPEWAEDTWIDPEDEDAEPVLRKAPLYMAQLIARMAAEPLPDILIADALHELHPGFTLDQMDDLIATFSAGVAPRPSGRSASRPSSPPAAEPQPPTTAVDNPPPSAPPAAAVRPAVDQPPLVQGWLDDCTAMAEQGETLKDIVNRMSQLHGEGISEHDAIRHAAAAVKAWAARARPLAS